MQSEYREAIATIVQNLPPESWAPAFTGLLLRVPRHRSEVFDYAQRLIQAHAYRYAPFALESLDLSRETLEPNLDYDAPANVAGGHAYVPRRAQWNGVVALDDPRAFRREMQWKDDNPLIRDLQKAFRAYVIDPEPTLHRQNTGVICAVHPYADCALIPAVLYGLSDLLGDGLSFRLVDWVDLPTALRDFRLDVAYCSNDLIGRWPELYEFRMTRNRPSRIAALCRVPEGSPSKTVIERVPNFNGYYTTQPNGRDEIVHVRIGDSEQTYSSQAHASTADNEAKHILALAAGILPSSCVITTLQGYLWAADAGLLLMPRNNGLTLGTLVTGEVVKNGSAGTLGFAVRIKNTKAVAHQLTAALQPLLREVERRFGSLLKEASDPPRTARRLLALLKAPIVAAQHVDSGILSRISSVTALRALLPDGDLFEREIDYKPEWWECLTPPIVQATTTARANALQL